MGSSQGVAACGTQKELLGARGNSYIFQVTAQETTMKSVVKIAVVAMVALQCTTDAAPASRNLRASWGGGGGGGGDFIGNLIQSCLNAYGRLAGGGGGGGGQAGWR